MTGTNACIVGGVDMTDLYAAPFPDEIPTAQLGSVSAAKLVAQDEQELQRIFRFSQDPGFFNLDLRDDPDGAALLQDVADCCRLSMRLFTSLEYDQKTEFKTRLGAGAGILDMGYWTKAILPGGEVKYNEIMNFPLTDMFGYSVRNDFALPGWLDTEARDLIERTGRRAHKFAHMVLSGLEQSLELENGALLSAHRIEDQSGDFLRLLRYPVYDPAQNLDQMRFPAHTDVISLGLLFTWVGGLQLPAPDAVHTSPTELTEESWQWVRPIPGMALVNMGDALEFLTNGTIKAGLHRVVCAPKSQASCERYSVLCGLRPANDWPMTVLKSPVIPSTSDEQNTVVGLTCAQWGHAKVKAIEGRLVERDQRKEILHLH